MKVLQLSIALAALVLSAATAGERASLTLGSVGFAGKNLESTVRGLAGYLGSGLGRVVKVELFEKYEQVLEALEAGKLDLALLTPVNFLAAHEKLAIKPLASPLYASGEANYRAVILALAQRADVAGLLDLRGKSIAFVDTRSASGYVVPRGMLARAGVRPGKDAREVFTGNHVKSIEALVAGKVDAAATYDMLLAETPSIGHTMEEFTVLAQSDPIPGEVLAGSRTLSAANALLVKQLLLAFGERRKTDPKLSDSLYQEFHAYEAGRYEALRKLWKAASSQ